MRKLGELLLQERVITVQQLVEARRYESANAVSLSRALVALGFVVEEEIPKALSRVFGWPTVRLDEFKISPEAIELVPAEIARKHGACPLGVVGRGLLVAVADPTNVLAMEEIHAVTNHAVGMALSTERSIEEALDRCYGPPRPPSPSPLEDAVGRAPGDPNAWIALGNHYGDSGQYELARIAFGQAVRCGPQEGQAHWGVAATLLDLHRNADAVAPARKAVTLAPGNRQARLTLGRALARSGRPHQAVAEFREAARLSPDWPVAWEEQGFALGQLGDHRGAAECLETALRIDPDKPRAWTALGFSLSLIGDWKGAANALETAVFARPDDGWTRALLGSVQRELKQLEDARHSLAEGIRLGCDAPWAWHELGEVAAAIGDRASLARAHEHLRTRDPRLARKLEKHLAGKHPRPVPFRAQKRCMANKEGK
jgi:tetratricopeptide (TPR) repeat protein